jgi:hypothetical protein
MTTQRDFDQIARAWLELSPDEAPDRTIAAVLDAVATTPQVRTWRPVLRRLPLMNRPLLAAVVAAGLIVAVGGGIWISRPGPNVGGPSSQPFGSPRASASGLQSANSDTPIPVGLRSRWFGGIRPVSGLQPGAGASLDFQPGTFGISQSNHQEVALYGSTASVAGDGRLRFVTSVSRPDCNVGDVGTYPWTLSPSGQTLTIGAGTDMCAARQAAVTGVWWSVDCKVGDTCLGDLDAGTYGSEYIDPLLAANAYSSWAPRYGALSFTVPDGWANSADWPSTFKLTPTADYALETKDGPPDGVYHEVEVFTEPAAAIQDGTCDSKPEPSVGRSVDALVAWLEKLPSIATTKATPITIGGHAGRMLDVAIDPGWKTTCPGEPKPLAQYLVPAGVRSDGYSIGVFPGERQRLILLDLGKGDVLGILIDDRNDSAPSDASRFDALVAAAMPVIQGFTFK